MLRHKAPIVVIVLLVTFAIVVLVGQMKNWSETALSETTLSGTTPSDEEKRAEQIVSISESIVSIGQTLISAIVSFFGLILRWIINLILAVVSFLTSSVAGTATTTTQMTTSPAVIVTSSSSSTAASTAVSTVPMATTTAAMSASTTSVMSPTTSSSTMTTTPTSSRSTTSTLMTTTTPPSSSSSSSSSTTSSSTTTTTTTSTTVPTPTKVAFVTNETFNGDLGGVDGADAKCSMAATRASLDGKFLAWISNSSTSPSIRFNQSVVPYVLVNGTVIATNYSSMVGNRFLLEPLIMNEYGEILTAASPTTWTATDEDGTDAQQGNINCDEWTDGTSQSRGIFGSIVERRSTRWSNLFFIECDRARHLYCFEQ